MHSSFNKKETVPKGTASYRGTTLIA